MFFFGAKFYVVVNFCEKGNVLMKNSSNFKKRSEYSVVKFFEFTKRREYSVMKFFEFLKKNGNILLQYSFDKPVKDDAQRLLTCCSSKRYQELPAEKEYSVRRTIIGPHLKKIIL